MYRCRASHQLLAASTSSPPGALHVLATETFLSDMAQNVAGQRLHIDTLLTPGIDPHEFQPAPQDAIKIAQSQVLIVNGLGYETWLTKSLQDAGGQRLVVVATPGIDPELRSLRRASGWRSTHVDGSGEGGDLRGQYPGRAYRRPTLPVRIVYTANASAYIPKLKDLDTWIKTQVAEVPPEKRLLVTNHDALGYFADAYGFKVVGAVIPSVTDEASPSAQQMASLIDTVKSNHAPAIFLDASENQNLANQIASESGAKVVTDLYVETLSASEWSRLELPRHAPA